MKLMKLLFLASWVLLLVLSVGIAFVSLGSLGVAFSGAQDNLTPTATMEQINTLGGEDAVKAFRGRRATAATSALGGAFLAMFVVLVPYRRGERWAWWALLVSLGLSQLASLARAVLIGTTAGTATPAVVLAFLFLGLLAGTPRMFGGKGAPPL